ncbi:bifunctional metallophosphatase/5'-nucleotidase [Metabacillus sp. RGM 3146]|uniref:bifunctional metallophosphatase/5'-nucleotidase n=1 Tax=Metabacillus sp. RGM 3146 TaxID=3401092 RepID=UPI003B9B37FE
MKQLKIVKKAALSTALLFGLLAPQAAVFGETSPQPENPSNRGIHVQLLGVNDFHGQIDNYRTVNGKQVGGAEYLAAYIKKYKKQNKNTLTVSAGDTVGASSPTSALLQDEPTIRIFNKIGFDVSTIGNHEFDEGVPEMKRLIYGGNHPATGNFEGADFPYVCANAIDQKNGKPILPPFFIKKVNGMPIGFIGVVTQETKKTVMPTMLKGVEITDEVQAINKYAKLLKAHGVKSIVVLAHNPASSNPDGTNPQGDAVNIANNADDEVDVIFAGHNHAYANTTVDNKLIVQGYSYGTAFTDVDLEIDPKTKDIVKKSGQVITTFHDGIKPDQEVKAMVDKYKEEVAPKINKQIGEAKEAITGTPDASGESALGNFIADAQRVAMGSDFAFMNPGGIRADLNAGTITWGNLFSIQPFNNTLTKMTLTGAQIKAVLEQQFIDNNKKILQVSGLKVTWDQNAPVGQKMIKLTDSAGNDIAPDKEYTVTVNSFLASGGDGFTKFTEGKNQIAGPVDLDALVKYIQDKNAPISAPPTDRIDVQ